MRKTIEQYISSLKKVTVDVFEVESFFKKQEHLQRDTLVYKVLANVILELAEEGIIIPIRSSKPYAMDNRIFNRYKKVRKQEDDEDLLKNEMLTAYDRRMSMVKYLKKVQQYLKDKEILMAISDFLLNQKPDESFVSVNERSYQLFGNEKLLFSNKGSKILKNIGATYEDLCCYQTYEPFFYYQASQEKDAAILIVENKDTFFSLKKLFMEGYCSWNGISFSMLIYGEGNKITRSIDYLEELNIPDTKVYYFGDLDPMGLTIFYRLKTSSSRKIHLMVPFYREMWNHRKHGEVKNDQEWNERAIESFSSYFDPDESELYIQYLKENKYIPQEALHIELLRGLSDGPNQAV